MSHTTCIKLAFSFSSKCSTSAKMPVVFKQELHTSEAECVPKRRMSSWGFLSFMIAVTNAVINISNNVNNNLNNNNNNNNQNSNNQVRVTY